MKFGMFSMGFSIFSIMFIVVFIMIIVSFAVMIVKNISTWNKNNHSPKLDVSAKVVSKRINVVHHKHANAEDITGGHGYHTISNTLYYVTFEFTSGDRMEFHINGAEYGLLKEGDTGNLCFQGTRYLSFERDK